MPTNDVLRARGRENLGGSIFHTNWLTGLGICLVASIISNIFPLLLGGPIAFGLSTAYLRKARGADRFVFDDLFLGFEHFVDCLVLYIMQTLLVLVWFLIPIAGIYFGIRKAYSYAMCFYIKADNPAMPWRECLDRSAEMMEGHRWELFCLELSFIGWALLGSLACGIGIFWVNPYQEASVANFYEELRRPSARAGFM